MFQKNKGLFSINDSLGLSEKMNLEYEPARDNFEVMLSKINNYFAQNSEEKNKFIHELKYLNNDLASVTPGEKKLYAIMPYPFVNKYDFKKVEVFRDDEAGMMYVYLNGKKLYYHAGYKNKEDVQKSFTYINAEQDDESPHKYLDGFFNINDGDVVVDLGAAEGNFSLSVIEKVKEIFIVEAENIWIEALHKTFEPWKNKVHIINKFAGNTIDDKTVTLRELIKEKRIDAIKMDIEGGEISVLENSKSLISDQNIKMAITTYHRSTDALNIKILLEQSGYRTIFSNKFLLFVYDKLKPPYFRKGLIRAVKNKTMK